MTKIIANFFSYFHTTTSTANIPIQDFPGHDGYYYNNEFQTTNEKKDKSEFAEIKKIAQCKRKVARSLVGTPNYISPEVLNLDGKKWWQHLKI